VSECFEATVPLRYSDIDSYGHVNNAVYATLIEEARIAYLEAVLGDAAKRLTAEGEDATGIVVASLELEFQAPVGRTDAVTIEVEVPRVRESSFPMSYSVHASGSIAAVGETTLVAINRATGASQPLPQTWRERIREYEGL
jgi:acyl-CoA thioester hydrolase